MSYCQEYHARRQHAKQRRLQKERERQQRGQAWAQRSLRAMEAAIADLGLPEPLAAEVRWHLQAQQQLVCKICGMMFPPVLGCRSCGALCRVRGWDKHLPGRILGGPAQAEMDQAVAASAASSAGSPVAAGGGAAKSRGCATGLIGCC